MTDPPRRRAALPGRDLLDDAERAARLRPPAGRLRVVIDTDAANEVDDQFALAYAALSQDRLAIEAVYAAPFQREPPPGKDPSASWFAATPSAGMAASRAEIGRVAAALGEDVLAAPVHAGSTAWLPAPQQPVPSPAAADLVRRGAVAARADADPLYVVTLGAPTNVASALLTAPEIARGIIVVWLGGNGSWWQPAAEFNVTQDMHAARVLLDSGVPLVHVPCRQVTEKLTTTPEEVERCVRGRGRIGDHLADLFARFDHHSARRKELWDLGPVAWLLHPPWCPSALVSSPLLHDDGTWGCDPARHLIREVRDVDADAVMTDVFARLPPRGS